MQGGGQDATAAYDAQDRLVRYGDATYEWTASGSLKSKVTPTGATQYTYDLRGALREVTLPDGRKISYVIDGLGRRVGKKVGGQLVQGFLYQSDLQIAAELDGNGTVKSTFVYASHLNVPDYLVRGGVAYKLITDALGSVRLVVNTQTGEVAQRIDYDEFGRVLKDSAPGLQPFGFAGGIWDPDTRLVRFGARDYDPDMGRWTARDPILFDGGDTSLFAYASDDPVNHIDPTGKIAWALPLLCAGGGCEALAAAVGTAVVGTLWGIGRYLHDQAMRKYTEDEQALQDLIEEGTDRGDSPLCADDAEAVLDWAEETGYPGIRASGADVRGEHWIGPHIHIPNTVNGDTYRFRPVSDPGHG